MATVIDFDLSDPTIAPVTRSRSWLIFVSTSRSTGALLSEPGS